MRTPGGYVIIFSHTSRLSQASAALESNGGVLTTDLDDPKLTHIIVDDDDSGRYAELSRRTSKLADLIFNPSSRMSLTDQTKAQAYCPTLLGG